MSAAFHKTSQEEFRAALDAAPLRKLGKRELREKYGDPDDFVPDAELPFGGLADRSSNRTLEALDETSARIVDELVERFGLLRVLRQLRQACDDRVPSDFELDITFEHLEAGQNWEAQGTEIETLIARMST